jgi:hypothetical protein
VVQHGAGVGHLWQDSRKELPTVCMCGGGWGWRGHELSLLTGSSAGRHPKQ